MPLPESLLTATWNDLDLRVVAGEWPAGVHGEMFISAPVVDPRLSFQLFGFGAMVRLSLQPGTFGAPADRFALRVRTIDTPVQRIHDRTPDAFHGGVLGLDSPYGHANMANTAPLGWGGRLFATWDVGRPGGGRPGDARVRGRGGQRGLVGWRLVRQAARCCRRCSAPPTRWSTASATACGR